MTDYPTQRTVRRCLMVMLAAWPLTGIELPIAPFAPVLGALLAYYGPYNAVAVTGAILMAVIELIYGMDFGVLSLAYIVAVLIFRIARHWFALSPLAPIVGWPIATLMHTVAVGVVSAVIMAACSLAISAVVYGHTEGLAASLAAMTHARTVAFIVGVAFVEIVVLHRVVQPFRRKMIFGAS